MSLKEYIELVLTTENSMLESDDSNSEEETDDEVIDEFSGVGGIAGYTLPLGVSPTDVDGKKRNVNRLK